jgi:hypothetical protein
MFSGSVVIAVKPEAEQRFCASTVFLFCILKKVDGCEVSTCLSDIAYFDGLKHCQMEVETDGTRQHIVLIYGNLVIILKSLN